jgi:hypothetical protein
MKYVYSCIGWFYLWTRYRNKKKVYKILKEKYDNNYFTAGALVAWKTFGIILFGLISLLILAVVGRILYDLIS